MRAIPLPLLILSSLPQLVVDGLVEPDAHAGHLLEHPLPPEALQAVDLQLRVPDVLQALGGHVDLLQDGRKNTFWYRSRLIPVSLEPKPHNSLCSVGEYHRPSESDAMQCNVRSKGKSEAR